MKIINKVKRNLGKFIPKALKKRHGHARHGYARRHRR